MKIAILDDLERDAEIISEYLKTYFVHHCINMPLSIHRFQNGKDLLSVLKRDEFDIIFTDYYMDSISGLDTASAIRKIDQTVIIIFTTASREFAIDGYKIRASGYLVKPISYEDFSETMSLIDLQKIRAQRFIQIKNGYKEIKIPLNDIVYCDILGHYAQIHAISLGLQRSRMSFGTLSRMLSPYSQFLRCYRGCIINKNYIDHVDHFAFVMNNKERIPLPRKHQAQLLNTYSEFLFDKARTQSYEGVHG